MTNTQRRALKIAASNSSYLVYTGNRFSRSGAPTPTLRSLERLGYLVRVRSDAYQLTTLGAAMLQQEG